ncbi:hypothetical protein B484DRAFT_284613 [Ochromonadaceae sp. CCMP2298]|nr:hypothetical protein B484DRAFT_284613 [Ochromonadaceae sp. CCMP2298]
MVHVFNPLSLWYMYLTPIFCTKMRIKPPSLILQYALNPGHVLQLRRVPKRTAGRCRCRITQIITYVSSYISIIIVSLSSVSLLQVGVGVVESHKRRLFTCLFTSHFRLFHPPLVPNLVFSPSIQLFFSKPPFSLVYSYSIYELRSTDASHVTPINPSL